MGFVQDNQSMSVKGVLRGAFISRSSFQGKLVRVVRGSVFDVAVDLRSDSETYGKWFGVLLSAENKKAVLYSGGLPTAFWCCLTRRGLLTNVRISTIRATRAEFLERSEIGIDWPIEDGMELIISDKDQKWAEFGIHLNFNRRGADHELSGFLM